MNRTRIYVSVSLSCIQRELPRTNFFGRTFLIQILFFDFFLASTCKWRQQKRLHEFIATEDKNISWLFASLMVC